MTVFSVSGRLKSPEWRWQRRRADLRHFEIFRHGSIIIYIRLPAGGTYYPICTFPASNECLIGISDAFCLRVSVIFPTCSLYPQQKRAYSALHPQAWTYIYTGPCPKALTECSPLDFRRWSIERPVGASTGHYNYRKFYSIVLLAVVDANYNFLHVDVACNGRVSDGGVLANSTLFGALENNTMHIPRRALYLTGNAQSPSSCLAMRHSHSNPYLMKPYPGRALTNDNRILHHILSRARRVVENVFGILTKGFGVLQNPIGLCPTKAAKIVLACCALHNFLRSGSAGRVYMPPQSVNTEQGEAQEMVSGDCVHVVSDGLRCLANRGRRSTKSAHGDRDELCDYFSINGWVC